MQSIRGFVTKSDRINNTVGVVADFFELSPLALTYSRTRGEYQHSDYPSYTLQTFRAVDEDSGEAFVLSPEQSAEVLAVTDAVVMYMATQNYPYDVQDLLDTVRARFTAEISDFVVGDLRTGTQETMPEWLAWTSQQFPNRTIRIWLCNDAFENQYTDYEIVTVSPLDQLDRFFGAYGSLATQLKQQTIMSFIGLTQVQRGNYPETVLRVFTYNYVNPNNLAQKTPVYWGVLVYGKNGDNVDAIKDALADYLLTNSTHPRADWEVIFPEIFQRTEFLLFPRWDRIAIPNLTQLSALYSAAQDPQEVIAFAKQHWTAIEPSFIDTNLTLVPFDYKALAVVILNGQKNAEGKQRWPALFPDYLPVSTSSPDFNRMSIYTRDWMWQIQALLVLAESMTAYSSLPNPYRRIVRDGIVYVSTLYDNVNYLVAARSNLS